MSGSTPSTTDLALKFLQVRDVKKEAASLDNAMQGKTTSIHRQIFEQVQRINKRIEQLEDHELREALHEEFMAVKLGFALNGLALTHADLLSDPAVIRLLDRLAAIRAARVDRQALQAAVHVRPPAEGLLPRFKRRLIGR